MESIRRRVIGVLRGCMVRGRKAQSALGDTRMMKVQVGGSPMGGKGVGCKNLNLAGLCAISRGDRKLTEYREPIWGGESQKIKGLVPAETMFARGSYKAVS